MRTYNISKDYFDQFQDSTRQISGDALHRILHENLFFMLPQGLEKVDVPVLVIMGEKDYKVIKESAGDLDRALPTSQVYIVPKKGHMWNIESPKLFNHVLRNFLTGKPISLKLNR
jgi:pimeloyl-ACP methyl ester carboxylesterase